MPYTITNKIIKQILLILICAPTVTIGQCIKGDCENGLGIYLWPTDENTLFVGGVNCYSRKPKRNDKNQKRRNAV